MFGYMDRILRVNLSTSRVREEGLDEKVARNFLGGSGMASKILSEELRVGIDPLSPENKLVFCTGPLVGTVAPCSGMFVVASKSPLTGLWGHSLSSGFFGAELKFCGFDALIVEGQAPNPVCLWISPDEVEIRNASSLWTKDVYQTMDAIQKRERGLRVACIGLGGEKLIRYATIISDKYRAAGRTGMGAVMGSKKLKAVVVKGSKRPIIAKPEVFDNLVKQVRKLIAIYPGTITRRAYGTSGGLAYESSELGNLPTKYFQEGVFKNAEKITGKRMAETILVRRTACFMCPIGCGRFVEVKTGPFAGVSGRGPEYETIASFGSLCMNDNLESIAKANDLCNRWGIDTISTGNAIAFIMECRERGWIEVEGIDLTWGNHKGIIAMIEKIAKRKGIGDILAEGVKRTAEKIGKDALKLAMHVKGLEVPMHDPRAQFAMGLQYATSTRGAIHKPFTGYVELFNRNIPDLEIDSADYNRFSTDKKAILVKTMQDLHSIYDSSILCMFAYPPCIDSVKIQQIAEMLSSATGLDFDVTGLLKIGERIWNLQRIFDIREGASGKDDTLPKRFLLRPHSIGPCKGNIIQLEPMLKDYYELRGWDSDGMPTKEKLEDLGLERLL